MAKTRLATAAGDKTGPWARLEAKRQAAGVLQSVANVAYRNGLLWMADQVVRGAAMLAHAQYHQYDGHWDDVRLVVVNRKIVTKAGVAFLRGDVSIADVSIALRAFGAGAGQTTVYSLRNGIDTVLENGSVTFVEATAVRK